MTHTTIITVTNRKGGVSKTTSAVTLSHALAREEGGNNKVLLLDLDPQGHCAQCLGLDPDACAVDALEGRRGSADFIRPSGRPGLDIIPGNRRSTLIEAMHKMDGVDLPDLRQRVAHFTEGYDYLLIDTAPDGYLQEVGIYLADILIVPAALDYLSVEGVTSTLAAAEQIGKRYQRTPSLTLILPTFVDRTRESKANLDDLNDAYGDKVATTPIPTRVEMREAVACGQTIWEYKPNGDVAAAYRALIQDKILNTQEGT